MAATIPMKPGGQPLTEAEVDEVRRINDLVRQMETSFQERNQWYAKLERIAYLLEPPRIPEGFKEVALGVNSPMPLHIVNTIAAALTVNPPSIHFEPVRIGESSERNAGLRKNFFEASWTRQEDESQRALFRAFAHSVILYGEGILKTTTRAKRVWSSYGQFVKSQAATYDAQVKAGKIKRSDADDILNDSAEEYKRRMPYPIVTTDIPPQSFFYDLTEDGFTVCIEKKLVPYYETLQHYEMGVDSNGDIVPQAFGLPSHEWARFFPGNTRRMIMIEVWTSDKVSYLLQGQDSSPGVLVKTIKHRYGDKYTKTLNGPYFHCGGITTSSRELHLRNLGVLYGYTDIFRLFDSLITTLGQAAFFFGFPVLVQDPQPGVISPEEAQIGLAPQPEEDTRLSIKPGDRMPPGWHWEAPPQAGADIDKMLQFCREMSQLALPPIAQGVMSGDTSGYGINQLTTLARLYWDPIIQNMERCLAKRVGFESWLISNEIKENVYVEQGQPIIVRGRRMPRSPGMGNWLAIGPEDLSDVHRYSVRLDPETPSNELLDLRAHELKRQLRFESWEMGVTETGSEPDLVEFQLGLEDAKAYPEIQDDLKQQILQLLGKARAAADQQAQADLGQAGQLYAGPPPEATAPVNTMGTPVAPGAGMPITPTAPASGGGPPGMAVAGQGGGPGGVQGNPVQPNPPAAMNPLPGR